MATPHSMNIGSTQDGTFTFLSNRITEAGSKRRAMIKVAVSPDSKQNVSARAAGLPTLERKDILVEYDCTYHTVSVLQVDDGFSNRTGDEEAVNHAAVTVDPTADPVDANVMAFACLPAWRRTLATSIDGG
jgi:hypothetical protein